MHAGAGFNAQPSLSISLQNSFSKVILLTRELRKQRLL